jgi:hypothetical protein
MFLYPDPAMESVCRKKVLNVKVVGTAKLSLRFKGLSGQQPKETCGKKREIHILIN